MLEHTTHHRGRHDAGKRVDRTVDRDHRPALRHRRELTQHRRTYHIDRSAKSGAEHEKRDLQTRTVQIRQNRKDRSADHQGRRAKDAARAPGRYAARHHHLRNPSRKQHHRGTEHPRQNRNPPGLFLRKTKTLDDERREPCQPQRQRPIRAERRCAAANKGPRGQKLKIGDARIGGSHRCGLDQWTFLAQNEPGHDPHQADHAKHSEGVVPAIIHDHPVQRRHRKDHAEGRSLRQDRGGKRSLLVREPLVDRVRGHRERRALTGSEDNAANQKRGETDRADHWKLRKRPYQREREQHPAGVDAIDDEPDHNGRE